MADKQCVTVTLYQPISTMWWIRLEYQHSIVYDEPSGYNRFFARQKGHRLAKEILDGKWPNRESFEVCK